MDHWPVMSRNFCTAFKRLLFFLITLNRCS